MKRIVVLLLTAVVLVVAISTSALAGIRIKRIAFDPPGEDSGTNRHLNKEWIFIKNTGDRDVQMRRWKIFDRGRDHIYRFGRVLLRPGDRIKLHTGRGDDGAPVCMVGAPCPDYTSYDFYWGLDDYVWDNDGDAAILKSRRGRVVDRCRYKASSRSPMQC
jgi:hypothetical protein